jgi:hypothetical protein
LISAFCILPPAETLFYGFHALKEADVIDFMCASDRYEERAAPIPIIGFAILVSAC